jgi:hypothetical protein
MAPGAPSRMVGAPGSSGKDPLGVHAQPDDDANITPRLAAISDKPAQDHERHDLRLEY